MILRTDPTSGSPPALNSRSCGLIQGSGSGRFAELPCWSRMMDAVFAKSSLSDCRQHCGGSRGTVRPRSPWRARSVPGAGRRNVRGHGAPVGKRSAETLPAFPARFPRMPTMHGRRFRSEGPWHRPGRWRSRLGNVAGRSRHRPVSKGERTGPEPGRMDLAFRINNADNTYYVKLHMVWQQLHMPHSSCRNHFKSMG